MRAVAGLLVLCIAARDASAQPHAPSPEPAPAPGIEVAGTWSGKTNEPKAGWRAAIVVPIENRTSLSNAASTRVAFVARFDDHGAPAEHGLAETHATSWGAGIRAMTTWTSSNLRLGVFAEGTIGRTRARHADEMTSYRARHWMASAGILGGTRAVQLVADFGWLFTDAGDGRVGPIASLGLHLAFD